MSRDRRQIALDGILAFGYQEKTFSAQKLSILCLGIYLDFELGAVVGVMLGHVQLVQAVHRLAKGRTQKKKMTKKNEVRDGRR